MALQVDRVVDRLREPVLPAGRKPVGDFLTNVPVGSTPNPVSEPFRTGVEVLPATTTIDFGCRLGDGVPVVRDSPTAANVV